MSKRPKVERDDEREWCCRCGQQTNKPTSAGILMHSFNQLMYAIDRSVSGPHFDAKQRNCTVSYSLAGGARIPIAEGTAMAMAEFMRMLATELIESKPEEATP